MSMSMSRQRMKLISRELLNALMDGGHVAYVYSPSYGRIAITEKILEDYNRLSGDKISDAAVRALLQIYEKPLILFAKKLAVQYPG